MSIVPQTAYSEDDSRQDGEGNSAAVATTRKGEIMSSAVAMRVGSTPSLQSKLRPVVPQPFGMHARGEGCVRERYKSAMRPDTNSTLSSTASTRFVQGDRNNTNLIEADRIVSSTSHVQKYGVGSLSFHKSHGQTASLRSRKSSANTSSGRWTAAEHEAFLQGLKVYGREWKKVATCIPTRTSAQIRSHAQKYFAKVSKEQQQLLEKRRLSLPDTTSSKLNESPLISDQKMSQSLVNKIDSIMKNPSEAETQVCKTLASLRERYKHLEERIQVVQAEQLCEAPLQSKETPCGPATAALALEQKSLRKAAEARNEKKKVASQQHQQSSTTTELSVTPHACVSLASMPSQGGFDSNDVIALSMLGCNLGRERIENETISIIRDESSLKMVRERLELIQNKHPRKLRKVDEHI